MSVSRSRRGLAQPLFLSAAVMCVLFLASAACGGVGETQPGTDSSGVASVEVNQTGGFAGVNEFYTVDDKVESPRRSELFDMVAGLPFRSLQEAYIGPNGCRDAFSYTVTVTYRDGTSKRVDAEECGEPPRELTDVIALTKEIGYRGSGN
ncbi:protealysin inhibitor emfourin [Nocardia sp. CS682]|uniref:protealysin inhibitor emfourin n=1 Tax=Nocardia sp. CS682 TaxID=1047172 RepID=UPI0010756261|nr:protealysin inhibitor emfourin [Nocardia sp. CS682]